jgi:hypothetical protein
MLSPLPFLDSRSAYRTEFQRTGPMTPEDTTDIETVINGVIAAEEGAIAQ